MPIYEFVCSSCGLLFDFVVPARTSSTQCKCGNMAERRNVVEKVSPPSIAYEEPMSDLPTTSEKEMDRRVGVTSKQNWKKYEEQKKQVDDHRKRTGNPHVSIGATGDPSELSSEELAYRKKIQNVMTKGEVTESYVETDDGKKYPVEKPSVVRFKPSSVH